MMDVTFSPYGISAVIAEIKRRNQRESYSEAEARLAEKMKPARLAPVPGTPPDDSPITDHDSRIP